MLKERALAHKGLIPTSIFETWCPQQESNLHTPHYLYGALVRYKLTSLPLSYGGIKKHLGRFTTAVSLPITKLCLVQM